MGIINQWSETGYRVAMDTGTADQEEPLDTAPFGPLGGLANRLLLRRLLRRHRGAVRRDRAARGARALRGDGRAIEVFIAG